MAEPSRDGCTTVQRNFLLTFVDTASKNLDQATLAQIPPAHLMRKGGDSEKYTEVTLSGEDAHWSWPRDEDQEISWTPASMNPGQLTSTPTKQDTYSMRKFK